MWQKFKEQILVILVIVVIVVGAAFWLNQKTVIELQAQQELKLAPLREASDALKAQNEENRRSLESTNKLLKDAIAKRESDLFRTDEEIQKLNVERMDALADAIAGASVRGDGSVGEGSDPRVWCVDFVSAP